MGHRRQRAGDGLRQHRRKFRLRRRLHARSGHRRKGLLRRIPHQRAGRRRRRRRAHARARAEAAKALQPKAFAELDRCARRSSRTSRTCRTSNSPSRTASFSCCRPATANARASPRCASRWRWSTEKLIDWKTAIKRVPADQLDQVLAPIFDRKALAKATSHRHRTAAGPGAATGKIYLNADRAAAAAAKGEKVLLVRNETSPEDLRGMIAAEGILTAKGGVSSHAALVARQMGKVCVCGAAALHDRLQREDGHGRRPHVEGRRLHFHRRHAAARSTPRQLPDGAIGDRPGAGRRRRRRAEEPRPTRTSPS